MNFPFLLRSGNPLAILSSLTLSDQRRMDFIETYDFPHGLKVKFAKSKNFLDAKQQDLVFTALRDYFYICHQARKSMVSMPSQIVDDAWHEFILFTKHYNDFCLKAFGRYLHHTPAEAMQSKTKAQQGIKRTWKIACRREGINPSQPDRLPLIFAIDGLLNIENGFTYSLNCLANNRSDYCATHIGCGSGDGGGSGCSDNGSSCDSDGAGCGGSCGGD